MDFYKIKERRDKSGIVEIYPDFRVGRSKDLMIRGKGFYAIWDSEKNQWSTDEYDVQRLVDSDLLAYLEKTTNKDGLYRVKMMSEFSSNIWVQFRQFMSNMSDSSKQLDERLTFQNTEVKKEDYTSKRLPYSLESGSIDAYEELITCLYSPTERSKLEWAIGAVVAGDAKDIQKFIVLYGEAGAGKSTVLNIIQKLFTGYYTTFEAKALTSSNNSFATEVFRSNPLVAIQHDGDLSKIEDNTKLNSIISHEEMTMNEKYKPSYMARINCFLFMATNKPVRITDAKSGIIRRLIDVQPTGNKLPIRKYQTLMKQIDFELGAIAQHCLDVYRDMGKDYYSGYRPIEMMLQTDVFFNFVEAYFYTLKDQDGVSLTQAYEMYKTYCDETLVEHKLPRYKFREELKNYFHTFQDVARINNKQIRSYYSGFITEKFNVSSIEEYHPYSLVLDESISLLDDICKDQPAQYANSNETPSQKWIDVDTKLGDIDTGRLHYVKLPENHIVIDFDLKDEKGNKSLERNIEAASRWPSTYSEFSKSGSGIHLHYFYNGDVSKLSRIFAEDIEVKVFVGNASLRRKLSLCNNVPIATISSGLPLKEKRVLNFDAVKSERSLRNLVERNLRKEIHSGTKPSVDFIHKILEDAYSSDLGYDLTDMRPAVLAFAMNSTNQSEYCVRLVASMRFKSDEPSSYEEKYDSEDLVFFDVEVFPNLLLVSWKFEGPDQSITRMINPSASEIEELLRFKLVGFNCRRYDNHILYARYMGYDNHQIYILSQKIINGSSNAYFAEAFSLSYADVYDFSTKKQSLKKFQIELGIHHQELGLPWDEPVDESLWELVGDYCDNDVLATEASYHARHADFVARRILSDLSGLTVNDTTQKHAGRIIFGSDKKPQDKFVYVDLSEEFQGYSFESGKSLYRGEDPGEGGYVYSELGIHRNVALLDVSSMHPTSIIKMNIFGPYTKKFKELTDARLAIKTGDLKRAESLLGGALKPYLNDKDLKGLSDALKIVINTVYGLTSAGFENLFRDNRNKDNIVAKRGALFMIDLKHAVQEQGFTVAHIKTDSIKIPDATPEIIKFVMDFGKQYGYSFDHEKTYEKMLLANDAVYIAKDSETGLWDAVGSQFAVPYVYKALFSGEEIEFGDLCETKSVSTAIYLDMNEGLSEDQHDYQFVGRVGLFCPISAGYGGGVLYRQSGEKYNAISGTKGYRWLEAEVVRSLKKENHINMDYYDSLLNDAKKTIEKYGDVDEFIS